jgi:hypothetical protein
MGNRPQTRRRQRIVKECRAEIPGFGVKEVAAEVTSAGRARGLRVFCERQLSRNVTGIEPIIGRAQRVPNRKVMHRFDHSLM